jgi:RNA polymerase sigma factor (sigma-70 family)
MKCKEGMKHDWKFNPPELIENDPAPQLVLIHTECKNCGKKREHPLDAVKWLKQSTGEINFSICIRRIRRAVYNLYKKQKVTYDVFANFKSKTAYEDQVLGKILLDDGLAILQPLSKEMMVLHFNGYTLKEIAKRLDYSEPQVSRRISKSKEIIKKFYNL